MGGLSECGKEKSWSGFRVVIGSVVAGKADNPFLSCFCLCWNVAVVDTHSGCVNQSIIDYSDFGL